MNQFAKLLQQGAGEVREYQHTSPDAQSVGISWLESLAQRLEVASSLNDQEEVERELDIIAHAILDCGPVTSNFAPSFSRALDALQRRRKRA